MSDQLALFPSVSPRPEGFQYQPDFIGRAEEERLIAAVAGLPLEPFQFGQFEGKRRVASFGYSYDFTTQRLTRSGDIPEWLQSTIRAVEKFGGPLVQIRQVLCTEYDIGVGIGWHRDKPQFGDVFGLSLGAPCKFRFRRRHGMKWERFSVEAEPRSLYLLSGEARDVWEHSIPGVDARRYSITFRTLRQMPVKPT